MALTAQQLANEAISPLPSAAELERATRVLAVAVQVVNDYAPERARSIARRSGDPFRRLHLGK